jgi:hypothetical protein
MDMRSLAMMFAGLVTGVAAITTMAGCAPATSAVSPLRARRECLGFLTATRTASLSPPTAWAKRHNKARQIPGSTLSGIGIAPRIENRDAGLVRGKSTGEGHNLSPNAISPLVA